MARYNRRKKVKRYHRSFYTREMKWRRALGVAVLVAVVLAAAWFAAPYVLDWATHTWYTSVRGRDLEAESAASSNAVAAASAAASSQGEQEQPTPQPTTTPEPTPEAQADGTAIVDGSWAAIERSALTDEAAIRAAAQQLVEQGVSYAVVTLKDSRGNIYYTSGVAEAANSIADTTVDAALIASVFKEEGLIPVAQLAAFRDPVAAYTERSMAIQYRSNGEASYLWLDAANAAAGGKAWLNPYSSTAVDFIGELIAEVHELGFDQVALSYVQFPAAVSSKQDFGSTGGISRDRQLASDIAAWQARFDGAVTLWLRYSLSECTSTPSQLGASAVQLGMRNLLVSVPEGTTLDDETRTALLQAAADAGVENVMMIDS